MANSSVNQNECSRCFNWKIKNFSYNLLKKKECLESLPFSVLGCETKWHLKLYPNGVEENDDYLRCCLTGTPQDNQLKFNLQMKFLIQFYSADGRLITSRKIKEETFLWSEQSNYVKVEKTSLSFSPESTHLPKDTLIIQCKTWISSNAYLLTKKTYMCTRFNVNRHFFDWPIKKFSSFIQKKDNQFNGTQFSSKSIQLEPSFFKESIYPKMVLYMGERGRIGIDVHIKSEDSREIFVACKISVLCTDKSLPIYVKQEHIFNSETINEEWSLEPFIPISELTKDKDQYLQDDCLTLFCEFAYSYGDSTSYYDEIHSYDSCQANECFENVEKNRMLMPDSHTLSSDLNACYGDPERKDFSDVKLLQDSKVFPAHKFILCSRSEYFRRYFGESNKNEVCLEVEDADTLQRVLHFMYSDEVRELQWESARSLYSAANFYEMPLLKNKCSEFFKYNLEPRKACEILRLAHKHSDEDFKISIRDYIATHRTYILCLPEWSELEEKDAKLAAETTRLILRKL
ncbi:protein roadkill [Caerostris darwini]|uniref:Protein roadkill n=1 Tax=Caerostris darwini TaxID=1538125 RepID=A0AAV4PLX0_9ARAC|nr:protein roadkill [Caerostris darwini]